MYTLRLESHLLFWREGAGVLLFVNLSLSVRRRVLCSLLALDNKMEIVMGDNQRD